MFPCDSERVAMLVMQCNVTSKTAARLPINRFMDA